MSEEESTLSTITTEHLKTAIITLRDYQVMLDRDLAIFYQVETRALKQAVKRNSVRFPFDFMFQVTEEEVDLMVSQNVIPNKQVLGGSLPFAFTEQGIASLSAVLKSKRAAEVHVQIMRTFVEMRRFITTNDPLLNRMNLIESQQVYNEQRFAQLFNALEKDSLKQLQGIFYDGQIHDAYHFVNELIRSAKSSITIIDNYIDDSVLTMLSKRGDDVQATIYTSKISKQLQLDLDKYHQQYATITVNTFKQAHDRFVILDNQDVYHLGASLKDLGKKWFAFSKMQMPASEILNKLGAKKYDE